MDWTQLNLFKSIYRFILNSAHLYSYLKNSSTPQISMIPTRVDLAAMAWS